MALVAIADTELDAEVDGNADKENREGDGNKVERTDRSRGKGGRCHEADEERGKNGDDDPPRAQSDEKNDSDENKGHQRRAAGALCDGAEFLIGERDRPGQADTDPVLRRQAEFMGGNTDGGTRLRARFARSVIEGGVSEDKATPFMRLRGAFAEH